MDLNVKVQKQNLQQSAYNQLRQMILDGTLQPGVPLNEKALMERLQVGRTPLREAMQQLQMEDALEIIPRFGTFVREIGLEEILALFQARMVLEPEIVRIVTGTAEEAMLEMFRDIFSKGGDRERMIRNDVKFHRFLYESTRNRYFIRSMEVICFQDQRIRAKSTHAVDDLNDTNQAHLDIISCMLKNDGDAACEAMRRHIRQSRETALELSFRQGLPTAD